MPSREPLTGSSSQRQSVAESGLRKGPNCWGGRDVVIGWVGWLSTGVPGVGLNLCFFFAAQSHLIGEAREIKALLLQVFFLNPPQPRLLALHQRCEHE